jgi:hypothetical protein
MSEYKRIPTWEALRQELVVCPYGYPMVTENSY